MRRALGLILIGFAALATPACATNTDDGASSADTTSEEAVRSFNWTVFPNPFADGTPNPAQDIRGVAKGTVSTNPTAVSGLKEWTISSLSLHGLPPNKTFGAHAHVLPCDNTQGGGHYQNVAGTIDPTTSEIWLDFTTNADGDANVFVLSPFAVRPGGVQSIVVHANPTDPATGKAGAKLACASLTLQ